MNAFFKIAVWVLIYVILGFTLADDIGLLIRAAKPGIVKVYLSRRAAAALIGAAVSVGCAVFAFYSFSVCAKAALTESDSEYIRFFFDEIFADIGDIDIGVRGLSELMYILSFDKEYIAA